MGKIYSKEEGDVVFTPMENYIPNTLAEELDLDSLSLPEDGSLRLGDNFSISVKELRACIKVMRAVAREQLPEEFI